MVVYVYSVGLPSLIATCLHIDPITAQCVNKNIFLAFSLFRKPTFYGKCIRLS